jgi:hypothetical protein
MFFETAREMAEKEYQQNNRDAQASGGPPASIPCSARERPLATVLPLGLGAPAAEPRQ